MLPTGHQIAPSVSPHRPAGGTAPHSRTRDPRMRARAGDVSYAEFIAAGWTDAELRAADLMK